MTTQMTHTLVDRDNTWLSLTEQEALAAVESGVITRCENTCNTVGLDADYLFNHAHYHLAEDKTFYDLIKIIMQTE